MVRKSNRMGGFTLTEILLAIVLLAAFVAVILPTFVRRRPPQKGYCIMNLRIIDSVEGQWALEFRKQNTDIPSGSDLQPYMGRGSAGELPVCPDDPKQTFDTSYLLHHVGARPTCKINPASHTFQ
jgi:hypothetical protein